MLSRRHRKKKKNTRGNNGRKNKEDKQKSIDKFKVFTKSIEVQKAEGGNSSGTPTSMGKRASLLQTWCVVNDLNL